jgi:hypothetical protein
MTIHAQMQWIPAGVAELIRLAHEQRSEIVNTETDLQRVVVEALADILDELTGANPQSHLLWDTRSRQPKTEDEISDHLRNRLQELTGGRRLVVNREVQLRRNKISGIPERTDIQVDAAMGGSGPRNVLSLPLEVKGAWNSGPLTAMQSQLVQQYMADLGVQHGCYVVLWPDFRIRE